MLFPAPRIHNTVQLVFSNLFNYIFPLYLHIVFLFFAYISVLFQQFHVHQPYLYRVDGRRSSAKKSLSQPGSKNGSRANTPGGTTSSGKSLLILSVMKRISQSAQRRSSSPRLSGGDSPLSATRGLPTTPSGVSAGCRMRPRRSLAVSAQPATPEVFSPAANTDATDRCVEPSVDIITSVLQSYTHLSYCMSYRFSQTISVIQSYSICHSVLQYLSFCHTIYVIQSYNIMSFNRIKHLSFSHQG